MQMLILPNNHISEVFDSCIIVGKRSYVQLVGFASVQHRKGCFLTQGLARALFRSLLYQLVEFTQ
jgi:hypothetical protein